MDYDGQHYVMINLLFLMAGQGGQGIVSLSGETISDTGSAPARALVIINTDGTVDKREGLSVTQIDSATDWIQPNASATSLYEVKWEQVSGLSLTTGPTESAWVFLTSSREFGYETDAPGTESGVITVHIRWNGGDELASATYALSATEE